MAGTKLVKKAGTAQQRFQQASRNFANAMAGSDYVLGLKAVEEAMQLNPGNTSLLADLALCQMRNGMYRAARETYLRIARLAPEQQQLVGDTWLDGLTEVSGWLGRMDDVRQYGLQALQRADARFKKGTRLALPDFAPPPFDAASPDRNIIAFSLYGAEPRYCESAVMNARLVSSVYPGWCCRFYLDKSVPDHVTERLRQANAQIIDMSEGNPAIRPVMWRFLVMDDPGVSRFLIRDCDALLSEREAAAVNRWVNSRKWFHHMRDYFTHTELLLAGMWGGCRGIFSDVAQMMRRWGDDYSGSARFVDQYFLRTCLWPTIRESLMSHDDIFGFCDAENFPPHSPLRWQKARFHVGSNASYLMFAGKPSSSLPQSGVQEIILRRAGEPDRSYSVKIERGEWKVAVPFFLAEELEKGELTLSLPAVAEAG